MSNGRFAYADGLRGLAALWVVLFHASEGHHVDVLRAALPPWLSRALFDWGHYGVALFFVLSGFVMMHSVRGVAITPQVGGRFLLRRFLRLTPPYYASIVFVVGYAALKARMSGQTWAWPSLDQLAAHAVYLQDVMRLPTLNIVYWTLCIEMQFYLAFTLLMVARARLISTWRSPIGAEGLMAASAAASLPWAYGAPAVAGTFVHLWYAFMVGVLVSAASANLAGKLTFAAFAVGLACAWAFTGNGFVGASLLAAAVLLLGGYWPRLARLLEVQPLQYLGLISYSLYLIHNQVTGAVGFVLRRFLPQGVLADLLLLLAVLLVCLLVATLGYRFVEQPSIAWSRRIGLPKPSR